MNRTIKHVNLRMSWQEEGKTTRVGYYICEEAEIWDVDGRNIIRLKHVWPRDLPRTPAVLLALAVLDGDEDAAWAISDDLQERRVRPDGFFSRDELLALLKALEWNHETRCPICGVPRWNSLTHEENHHDDGCWLALAIGKQQKNG